MKVDNKSDPLARQFQISEQLRFVNRQDVFNTFEFEYY